MVYFWLLKKYVFTCRGLLDVMHFPKTPTGAVLLKGFLGMIPSLLQLANSESYVGVLGSTRYLLIGSYHVKL